MGSCGKPHWFSEGRWGIRGKEERWGPETTPTLCEPQLANMCEKGQRKDLKRTEGGELEGAWTMVDNLKSERVVECKERLKVQD